MEAQGKEIKKPEKKKASAIEAIERFASKKGSSAPKASAVSENKLISLSYYHIDDYLTCPLKYKYVNILRVPIMEHHTVIYGRAMHEAVTKYFQFKMSGKKMALSGLLNAFSDSFDPQGFLDEKHQEERSRIGQQALIRFFNDEERLDSNPAYIEKEFSFILKGNKITGRFDRVDMEEGKAVIMDFKTSEIKAQKEADKRTKDSMQLALYALAYRNIFGGQDSDLLKVEDKIEEVSGGIRNRHFSATPAYMACTYCAYNQICPYAASR
jgi:DNA helicase-2/ATP-dependent DNA helicase PcrA